MLILLFAYALMGLTFSLGWSVMRYTQPFFCIGFRMTLAGILLLGYQYLRARGKLHINRADIRLFVQAMFFHIYLAYVAEFSAFQEVSGAKVALIYNMTPFLTALVAYLVLKEKMSMRKWVGLIIGFAGFTPTLLSHVPTEVASGQLFFLSYAEIKILISAISSAYGWILVKQLVRERKYSTITVNGVAMLGGGIFALISSIFFEGWCPVPVTAWGPFFTQVLALIILANLISYNIFGSLMRVYSATFIAFVGFSTPLFAALYDFFFFGQKVPMSFFLTIMLVFIGLYIFYQAELREARSHA